jgi:hypothetical protein
MLTEGCADYYGAVDRGQGRVSESDRGDRYQPPAGRMMMQMVGSFAQFEPQHTNKAIDYPERAGCIDAPVMMIAE